MVTFRRYERGGLLGNTFEIAVDGAALIVRISASGKRGRDQRRVLASPALAEAEAARLVAQHLASGYVEAPLVDSVDFVSAKAERDEREAIASARREAEQRAEAQAQIDRVRASVPIVFDAALEAECRAAPEDPAPWSVYTDFLLERGDPRGKIAAEPARRAELLELLGSRVSGTEHAIDFTYRHGFPIAATLKHGGDIAAMTRGFVRSPMSTFVTALRFGLVTHGGANDWRSTVEAIVDTPFAERVTSLAFDAYEYDDCMMHWVTCGDFGDLFTQFPRLDELRFRGENLRIGKLPATLRTFVRESCTMRSEEVAQIASRGWPALEHLEIWYGNRDYGATGGVLELEPILSARSCPRLRHLGIVNSELAGDAITALARSVILEQLHSLDLSMGTFGGERLTRILVQHAPAFRHLAAIDLSNNLLEAAEIDRIRGVLDNVIVTPQRDLPDEDGAARYVAEHE